MAVIEIVFEPYWIGDGSLELVVRWETIAAALLVLGLLLAGAWRARRDGRREGFAALRLDDLLYIVVGVLPGAVVGGRIVHGLAYLDVYAVHPEALLDPARGTLSMLGAVLGGTLSGAYFARVLSGSWRRWLDVAAPLLLLAIAGAKVVQFLGGGGQGQPWDGQWAVAFLGPGPWKSVAPEVPAHPAQLYEAAWALLGLVPTGALASSPLAAWLPRRFRQVDRWAERRAARGREVAPGRLRFGLPYLLAVAWWLLGRSVIAGTWRDEPFLGSLGVEGALGLVGLAAVLAAIGLAARRPREA